MTTLVRANIIIVLLLAAIAASCRSSMRSPFPNPYEGIDFSITNAPSTLRQLDSIRIPEVNIVNTNVHDFANAVLMFSLKHEKRNPEAYGVRFYIPVGLGPAEDPNDSPPPDPLITLKGTNVSLLKMIEVMADALTMDYIVYDKGLVRFVEKKGQ